MHIITNHLFLKKNVFSPPLRHTGNYQFSRIPFGVINGVAAFQRTLNHIIEKEVLNGIIAYMDDVTICGRTKQEHDTNLSKFRENGVI